MRSNNFLSLIGQGSFAIIGFASVVVLARSFEIEEYGEWVMYLTAVTFVEMIRTGFLNTALVRFASGTEGEEKKEYIASSWLLGIIATVVAVIIMLLTLLFFPVVAEDPGFGLFFKWFALYTVAVLPFNYATWLLQAKEQFGKIMLLKSLNMLLCLAVFVSVSFFPMTVEDVVLWHIAANGFTSILSLVIGFTGIQHIRSVSKEKLKELAKFGKYSVGTLMGTNLLKSSDTFIIGAFLGPSAAAIYSIPLKLTEAFEIILRSAVSVAIPKMSQLSMTNRLDRVKVVFDRYVGVLTIIYIPLLVICFVFAEQLVTMIGGAEYAEGALIFRVLMIYGIFLPLDRFTGITLDCINKPKLNFYKVILMVSANVIGDIIAVYVSGELWAVAFVTISTVIVGVFFGLKFLGKHFEVSLKDIMQSGWDNMPFLKSKQPSIK